MGAPGVRTDIVEVFVFRRCAGGGRPALEFLQLRRAQEPMRGTWQSVMGHVERDETAVEAALREVGEETGLGRSGGGFVGAWALERVTPYFLAESNCVVLSPRFAVEVSAGWTPVLNDEHAAHRWIGWPEHAQDGGGARVTAAWFVWASQAVALGEIAAYIADPSAVANGLLRLDV